MSGVIKKVTKNYSFFIPKFDSPNWSQALDRNFSIIDTTLFAITGLGNILGIWANTYPYKEGDRVYDEDNMTLWQCNVTHTSASTGTFLEDRTARPTYWTAVTSTNVYRGLWKTNTEYNTNEFLSTNDHRYGAVTNKMRSGATYDADVTAGRITTLIDLRPSVTAAATSATNAKTSETNAKNSATASANSAAAAKVSETNSKTSETNAKASETAALGHRNAAASSASAAASSAGAAKTSETNSKTSETNAKASENAAKASQTAAKTSETNAKNSENVANAANINTNAMLNYLKGGTIGQALVKQSAADYDFLFQDIDAGGDMQKTVYDATNKGYVDKAQVAVDNILKTDRGAAAGVAPLDANKLVPVANIPNIVTNANVVSVMKDFPTKSVPAETDKFTGIVAANNAGFSSTWAQIKAALLTFFNTQYLKLTGGSITGNVDISSGLTVNNIVLNSQFRLMGDANANYLQSGASTTQNSFKPLRITAYQTATPIVEVTMDWVSFAKNIKLGGSVTNMAGDHVIRHDGYLSGSYWEGFGNSNARACIWERIELRISQTKLTPFYQAFSSSGTWTKPAGIHANAIIIVECWAGGGGGGDYGAGGGGAYISRTFKASDLSATVAVTVGAGGAGSTNTGGDGGTTQFGNYLRAYGGKGGTNGNNRMGGGGGDVGAGSHGERVEGKHGNGLPSMYLGGGGGGTGGSVSGASDGNGGASIWGGGGGGGNNRKGGASLYGGNGGDPYMAGQAPAGGGGRQAAGARGEVRVRVVG